MASPADVSKLADDFAAHADACLIDAQAAVLEGNFQVASELRDTAATWVRLIAAYTGLSPDDVE